MGTMETNFSCSEVEAFESLDVLYLEEDYNQNLKLYVHPDATQKKGIKGVRFKRQRKRMLELVGEMSEEETACNKGQVRLEGMKDIAGSRKAIKILPFDAAANKEEVMLKMVPIILKAPERGGNIMCWKTGSKFQFPPKIQKLAMVATWLQETIITIVKFHQM